MWSENYICLTVVRFCPLIHSATLLHGNFVCFLVVKVHFILFFFLFALPSFSIILNQTTVFLIPLHQLMGFIPFSSWTLAFLFHIC